MANWLERQARRARNAFGDVTNAFGDVTDSVGDFAVDALDTFGLGPKPGRRAAKAAKEAAETQRDYGNQANQTLTDQYEKAQWYLDPYQQAGQYGLQGLMSDRFSTRDPGQYNPGQYDDPGQFDLGDLANDPGYKFRLNQGLDAVQSRISGLGGRGGGNAMTGINDWAQGFASNEVGNAFNRFTNQRDFGRNKYMDDRDFGYGQFSDQYDRQFNSNQQNIGRYSGLANMGFGAAGDQSANAMNYGQMYGNNLMGIGNSIASGQVGTANAINQGRMNNQSAALNLWALLKG